MRGKSIGIRETGIRCTRTYREHCPCLIETLYDATVIFSLCIVTIVNPDNSLRSLLRIPIRKFALKPPTVSHSSCRIPRHFRKRHASVLTLLRRLLSTLYCTEDRIFPRTVFSFCFMKYRRLRYTADLFLTVLLFCVHPCLQLAPSLHPIVSRFLR